MKYMNYREKIIDFIAKSGQDVPSFCKACKISEKEFGKVMAYEFKISINVFFRISFFMELRLSEFFAQS